MDLFKGSRGSGPDKKLIKEKNYFFLFSKELPHIDLSRYTPGKNYYGKLFLDITALQDIFIGCGEIEKTNNKLYDTFTYVKKDTEKKTLNIPGSSLKGSVLTNMLMFMQLDSVEFFSAKKDKARVFFSDFPMTTSYDLSPQTIPARFGPQNKAVPPHAQLKLYLKDDPAYGNLSPQEKKELPAFENILTIKKGSGFSGFINFKLVNEFQLTLLVLALGCLPEHRFNFKIGGAKNRAIGLIKIEINHEKSFYSENLINTSKDHALPFKNLESTLLSTVSRLKQDFPKLVEVLEKIQGEYGK
ncbi:MAG: hypothetical protein PVH61_26270 [Candidatus Aminicenantes bacterium]|jgi:hypothetical protein